MAFCRDSRGPTAPRIRDADLCPGVANSIYSSPFDFFFFLPVSNKFLQCPSDAARAAAMAEYSRRNPEPSTQGLMVGGVLRQSFSVPDSLWGQPWTNSALGLSFLTCKNEHSGVRSR